MCIGWTQYTISIADNIKDIFKTFDSNFRHAAQLENVVPVAKTRIQENLL